MKKAKWFLFILSLTVLIACYFLFYKSYSNSTIAKSADIVLSVDVKRNANTILAYIVTTPAEWNFGSILHFKKDTAFNWKDAIKIPDYIFIFHCKEQPAGVYYTVLTIKDEEKFQQGLANYNFKETVNENGLTAYYADKLNIGIIKKDDQVLIGSVATKEKALMQSVADEIFTKKEYINTATLDKIISAPNHFSIYLQKNDFLQEDGIINGNFKKGQLNIDADLQPSRQYSFAEGNFALSNQSLLNFAFTQPSSQVYGLLSANVKTNISTALNFNIDSLLSASNKKYYLDIAEIKTKVDSSVSYTFDDDFNKVEKVTVNKIQEPSFSFIVSGKDQSALVQYWIKNKNIEQNNDSNLFVSIPFVKTYVTATNDSLLLNSYNYIQQPTNEAVKCIAYFNINTNKIPANLANYLPDNISKIITNFESVNCIAKNNAGSINITLTVTSRDNIKPFLLSVK